MPKTMNGISIQVIFQEDDANGEICTSCKKEIKGTKYVMMIQVMDATGASPTEIVYCVICKNKWDKLEE